MTKMKIIHKNLKAGEVKLLIEHAEDLWLLSQLVDAGDVLKGQTVRKLKVNEEADATKRTVFMAISVEKVEFGQALRVSGKIIDGPEDVPRGSYHTFSLEPGTIITLIKKEWLKFQISRLEEAAESKRANILICVFDREDAFFALLKRSGADVLLHLEGDVEKKRVQTKVKNPFYETIVKQLEDYVLRYKIDVVILASPAFWKEELLKVLKNESLKKKIVQATCSSADERAIDEVLKRDEVKSALAKERTLREMNLVEDVLGAIAKKSAVAYGMKNVKVAADANAIATLLVTDTLIQKLRADDKFAPLDMLMRSIDNHNGAVVIISGSHDGGRKLDGLGGVAALLRYRLSED